MPLAALARPLHEEAIEDDAPRLHTYNGQPLPRERGGPVRKDIRGYGNTAHPWRNDRYS